MTGGRNLTVRVNMFHRKLREMDMGAIIVTRMTMALSLALVIDLVHLLVVRHFARQQ